MARVVLGRLQGVQEGALILGGDAAAHVRQGDEVSQRFKDAVDAYLESAGLEPPPLERTPPTRSDSDARCRWR